MFKSLTGDRIIILTNTLSGRDSAGISPAPIKYPQKSFAAAVSASFLFWEKVLAVYSNPGIVSCEKWSQSRSGIHTLGTNLHFHVIIYLMYLTNI